MRSTLLAAACRSGWAQIWSHPPGFAGVRRDPSVTVSPGHGRSRIPVNAGQHCWKACKGQPFRSSNLLSSATLTCWNTDRRRLLAGGPGLRWSQLLVSVSSVGCVPPPGFAALLHLVTGIVDGPERRGARCRSVRPTVRAGRGRPRPGCRLPCVQPDTRQLTDRITLSDREVLGERAPSRRSGRPASHWCCHPIGRISGWSACPG